MISGRRLFGRSPKRIDRCSDMTSAGFAAQNESRKTYDEIAESLLNGVSCPPTDLRQLFPRFNIKNAVASPLLPTAGKLTRIGDTFVILYAENLTQTRVDFTIAHEIAHA